MRRLAAAVLAVAMLLVASPAWAQTPELVGTSRPGLAPFPTAEVVRVFLPGGPQTFAESGQLRNVPAGKVLIVSFKDVPTAARWRTVLADWNATGRRIWWAWRHEADLVALHIAPATYRANYADLLDVWQPYRATSNVRSMTILSGSVMSRSPDAWYVPGVDAVGFDVYYLVNVPKVVAYAKAKGKPLAIPEWGDGTESGVGWQGDDKTLAFARQYVAMLDGNVFAACWWSVGHNDLARLPKTLAYLRGLT